MRFITSPRAVTARSASNPTSPMRKFPDLRTANALILLKRAAEAGGLKLTATGNLSCAVVEEMFGIIQAPDYDKAELLSVQKVINEPAFLPLHFVRILAQAAKFFRTYRGKMVPTPLGRRMLAAERHGPLQAILFHVTFWRLNLAYFDGYPLDAWPQSEVGIIIWSPSASAHDWQPRETLTRLPSPGITRLHR
jgi:hypothetical protein